MISKHQPSQPSSGREETKAGGQAQFGALLMTDGGTQRGPPSLFRGLTEPEIAQVLGSGKRRVLYRGAQLSATGAIGNLRALAGLDARAPRTSREYLIQKAEEQLDKAREDVKHLLPLR